MKKTMKDCIEVKATVTEVLDEKTDVIYDGGIYRNIERENWQEKREMWNDLRRGRGGRSSFRDRDDMDVDNVLPQQDWYLERSAHVRARYTVGGQIYERETVLNDTHYKRLAGKKIYLTIDPARPDSPLQASLYKSRSDNAGLFLCGAMTVVGIFLAAIVRFCHYCVW